MHTLTPQSPLKEVASSERSDSRRQQQHTTTPSLLLILIISVSAIITSISPTATAAMPTTITNGYFRCEGPSADCTVTSSSTVDVYSMIVSANGAGNTSVSFTAIKPTINGILFFVCPTTAYNFGIHILVENGFSTDGNTYFMTIKGKLAGASTIIIRGGSYSEPGALMGLIRVDGALQMLDGTSLLITGMTLSNVRIIEATGAISLFTGATVELSNIKFTSDQTAIVVTYFADQVYVSGGSMFYVRNVTCELDIVVASFGFFYSTNSVRLSDGTLEISNNTISVVTSNSAAGMIDVASYVSIESGSLFNISHNHVTVSGSGTGFVLLHRSWLRVITGSSFDISANNVNLSSTSNAASLIFPYGDITVTASNFTTINNIIRLESSTALMFYLEGLAVSDGSIVRFESNAVEGVSDDNVAIFQCTNECSFDASTFHIQYNNFSTVGFSTKLYAGLLFACIVTSDSFTVSTNSLLQIANNNISFDGSAVLGSAIFSILYLIYASSTCTGNSNITVSNNICNVQMYTAFGASSYLLYSSGTVTVSAGSSLQLSDNGITTDISTSYATYKLYLIYMTTEVAMSGNSSMVVSANNCKAVSLFGSGSSSVLPVVFFATTVTVNSGVLSVTTNTVLLLKCTSQVSIALFGASTVTLSNGAVLNHAGNLLNFTMAKPFSSYAISFVCSSITTAGESTLLVRNDTVLVGFSDDVPGYDLSNFTRNFIAAVFKVTNLAVSDNSAVRVEGCNVSAFRPDTPFAVNFVDFNFNSDVLFSSGGGMTISENIIEVCRYNGRILSVGTGTSNFTMRNGTYLVVDNNAMSSSCIATASLIALLVKTDLIIDANATMTVSNNNVINPQGISSCVSFDNLHLGGVLDVRGNTAVGSVRNTTMGQEGLVGVFGIVEGSVAQFCFVDNSMNMTTIGPLRERLTVFDDVYVVFADFNTSSMSSAPLDTLVVIANNTATWTGNAETRGNSGAIFAYLIIKGVPVPTGEFIHLINNTMTTTDFAPVYGLYLEMPPTPSSTIAVLNNNHLASGKGTPAWSALVLNTSSVDITTCGNTIESRQCGGGCEGNHPCIAYNRSRVNDCHTATCSVSPTPTSSIPQTPSTTLTTSHFTPTNSQASTATDSHVVSPSRNTHTSTGSAPISSTISLPATSTTSLPPTHSLSSTHPTPSSAPSRTFSHNTITMSLSDSAPTPTPGRTRSTTVVNPGDPCQMGCLAVRGVLLDGDIIATSGCGTVAFVPFISTENGKLAELVILLNDDARQRINASYDVAPGGGVPLGVDLIREVDGAEVSADLMGLREGPEYREARLHVGRRDITPLLRIVVRVSLPWAGFLCRKNTSATGGGLPWVDIELEAPPAILQGPSLAAVMVMGAASGALVGADLQTVAAMGMLGCAPRGSDSGVGDNVRALVPTALSNTCEGAIWGAVATLFVAVVVSTIVVLVYRRIKKKVSLVRACASMYCPSVALSIWGMLQTGLLVCGGQLMLTGGSSSFPGIVGLLFGLGIVPCYVVLADRIVSRRCYKMAPNMAAPGGRCGHRIMSFFLPTYELDKKEMPASKAFSAVVGRTRYSQSVWAAVWVSPPITLLLCVFARGELCKPMYMAAASCLVILAILHIAFRPNRSIFNNFLTAAALLINAALIGVGALLAYDPLDDGLQNASYALSLAQTFLTIIRLTITVTSFVIMKTKRSKWYTHQEPDGRPTKPDTKATPVFTVVGWLDPPLNAFGVPLEEFDDIKNIGDNNLEDDFINMDGVDDVDADDDDLAPTQIGAYTAPALLTKDAIEEQGSAPPQKSRSAREEVIEEEVLPDLVPTDRSDPSYSIVNGSAAAVEFGDGSGFKSECLVHGEHLTVLNNLLDNYHTDGAMRAAELPYRLRDEEQEEDEEEMQSQAASHNHLLVFEDDDDDYDGVLLDNNTPPLELSDTTDHDIDDEGGTKMSRNGRNLVAGSNGNGRNGMVHGMEEVIDSDDERLL